jgi:hypothetical protein
MSWRRGLPSFLFVLRIRGDVMKRKLERNRQIRWSRVIQKGANFNRGRPDTFPFTFYTGRDTSIGYKTGRRR